MKREQPGESADKLNRIVAVLETVSETLPELDARLKSLETRFEIHGHGPDLAELEIKIQKLSARLGRHAAFLRLLPAKQESVSAQLRKLFHDVSMLKRTGELAEQRGLFEAVGGEDF